MNLELRWLDLPVYTLFGSILILSLKLWIQNVKTNSTKRPSR